MSMDLETYHRTRTSVGTLKHLGIISENQKILFLTRLEKIKESAEDKVCALCKTPIAYSYCNHCTDCNDLKRSIECAEPGLVNKILKGLEDE